MFNKNERPSEVIRKGGQVGETVTWIVATVIIIVVLGISISFSSLFFSKDKIPGISGSVSADTLATKSLFSYVLTKEGATTVHDQIKTDGNLNQFNGNLGKNIFLKFYSSEDNSDYRGVWIGMFFPEDKITYVGNEYFGQSKPSGRRSPTTNGLTTPRPTISDHIIIDSKRQLEMFLVQND